MPEPMGFRRFTSPEGWGLAFSTDLPADMVAETVSSGEGDGVRFVAHFGGVRNEDAAVHFFVFPAGTTEADAREQASAAARGREAVGEADRAYPWSIAEYRCGDPGALFKRVALGRHADRFFYFVIQAPTEMGDGFAPRAREILRSWRWEDTGTGLEE